MNDLYKNYNKIKANFDIDPIRENSKSNYGVKWAVAVLIICMIPLFYYFNNHNETGFVYNLPTNDYIEKYQDESVLYSLEEVPSGWGVPVGDVDTIQELPTNPFLNEEEVKIFRKRKITDEQIKEQLLNMANLLEIEGECTIEEPYSQSDKDGLPSNNYRVIYSYKCEDEIGPKAYSKFIEVNRFGETRLNLTPEYINKVKYNKEEFYLEDEMLVPKELTLENYGLYRSRFIVDEYGLIASFPGEYEYLYTTKLIGVDKAKSLLLANGYLNHKELMEEIEWDENDILGVSLEFINDDYNDLIIPVYNFYVKVNGKFGDVLTQAPYQYITLSVLAIEGEIDMKVVPFNGP